MSEKFRGCPAKVMEVEPSFDEVNRLFYERGLTDGFPIVPPTQEKVRAYLDALGREPTELVGVVVPTSGMATVEKIVINAVMAGCDPAHVPVVIAATEAMCDPAFNLDAIQTTTNPATVALTVNGPVRKQLDINCGRNCLGQGWKANATIGRAVRLILNNIGGGKPGDPDKSMHGFPGKYSMCFGEDEEGSPWTPIHVDEGFRREDSAVTVTAINSTVNLGLSNFLDIDGMLRAVGYAIGYYGNPNSTSGGGRPVIALTRGHAAMAATAGMSKLQVKQLLFDLHGFPEAKLPPMVRKERLIIYDGVVKSARKPEDILIVVCGGPETYHAVYMPTFAASAPQTRAIVPLA